MRLTSTTLSSSWGSSSTYTDTHSGQISFWFCGTYALHHFGYNIPMYKTPLHLAGGVGGWVENSKFLHLLESSGLRRNIIHGAKLRYFFCVCFFNDFCNNQGRIGEQRVFFYIMCTRVKFFLTVLYFFFVTKSVIFIVAGRKFWESEKRNQVKF